ncbi:outer membrane protein assembly factor BamD [Candidatus Pelagibacter sp. HIMB1485]|uniref:outer membrane protein assembly factor BamD n=1 Tax=Candidatus Pelagibacter sp. HIMB1485 TaxID=3415415 RepID=UPI003F863795
MWVKNIFLILSVSILLISCSKKNIKEDVILEESLEMQVLEAYEEGMKALNSNDVLFAAKKFNEAEILFPQSEWAPKSALMAAYSYYKQDYYQDTIAEIERFLRIYPNHKNLSYAYYLLGISYYEQIVDEKKDLQSILKSKKIFQTLIENFPSTEYAIDAEFKIDLINDILASKEVYLGRYYVDRKKWIPAINRFRTVVDEYDETIYAEESLHRLVEIYYLLGLEEESKKYAFLLGYNYQSSQWYEKSYAIFDKMYELNKKENEIKKRKQNSLLKKFKSLFE